MKGWLKAIIIVLVLAILVTGGIIAYAHFSASKPVDVTPASNWLLYWMPNQTYIYGIVVSDESQILYREKDRTVLEMFVKEGDTVHVGTPLVRYDATPDELSLESKLLEREKLYNELQKEYAEYKRWARVDYERTIPTYTPSPSPTPRTRSSVSKRGFGSGTLKAMSEPISGSGTALDPFRYSIKDGEAVPADFVRSLTDLAESSGRSYYALISAQNSETLLTVNPDRTKTFRVTAEDPKPKKPDFSEPISGDGSSKKPFVFNYASKTDVPPSFLTKLTMRATSPERMQDVYARLQANGFYVSMKFTTDGGMAFYVTIVQPTPTPSPTPTPKPTPTASPTPEGSVEPTETPYSGGGWGISRADREEYARQAAQTIREDEVKYRQLSLEIQKLQMNGDGGMVYSEIEGTVSKAVLDTSVQKGEIFLEVRGGTGLHLVSVLGEMDRDNYPVGTKLTGFSYESGQNIEVEITSVSEMPMSTNYSSGGNPNSSAYIARMDFIGNYLPKVGEYIEFSEAYMPRKERSYNYLHEAYIREIDGQDCIFLVKDDKLVKTPVVTGKRMDQYIEILNVKLSEDDYLAFPYDKNAKDGAPVNYPNDSALYW